MTPPKNSIRHNKDKESKLVYKALYKECRPLTRREFSEITGLEIPTLCRILFNLTNKSHKLIISYSKRCKVTGKIVFHYFLANAVEGLRNGN